MANYNRPNFLASEVGLKLDTIGLDATTHASMVVSEVDDYGVTRSIIKQGTLYKAGSISGLIFQDVDVTGTNATTQKEAPLMTGGHYINTTTALPAVIGESDVTLLASHGLFADPVKVTGITRPY